MSQKQLYSISRNNFKTAVLQGLRILDRPTQGEDDLWTYTSDQMLPSVKLAILLFRERYSIHEAELRITIHASLDKDAMISPEFRFHVRIFLILSNVHTKLVIAANAHYGSSATTASSTNVAGNCTD